MTPEQKQLNAGKHNFFIGDTINMRNRLNEMLDAPTTTEETKHYARSILGLVTQLQNSLTVRKDG